MNDDYMKDMAMRHDLAEPEFLFVWDRFTKALEGISDQGSVDRGIGMGSADFWVKIAGKEWLCEVRPSEGAVSREIPLVNMPSDDIESVAMAMKTEALKKCSFHAEKIVDYDTDETDPLIMIFDGELDFRALAQVANHAKRKAGA